MAEPHPALDEVVDDLGDDDEGGLVIIEERSGPVTHRWARFVMPVMVEVDCDDDTVTGVVTLPEEIREDATILATSASTTRSSSAATTMTSPRPTRTAWPGRGGNTTICEPGRRSTGPRSASGKKALTSPRPTTSTRRSTPMPSPDTGRRAACYRGALRARAGARRRSVAPLNLGWSTPEPESGRLSVRGWDKETCPTPAGPEGLLRGPTRASALCGVLSPNWPRSPHHGPAARRARRRSMPPW